MQFDIFLLEVYTNFFCRIYNNNTENSWESKDSDEIKRDIHDPDKTLVKTEDSTIGVTVNVILTILTNT